MGRRPVNIDRLTDYLETRILSREYAPGDPLPSVRRLAGKFGLSYSTAYRALEKLCAAGLLRRRDSHGFFVADRPVPNLRHARRIVAFLESTMLEIDDASGMMAHSALIAARNLLHEEKYELEIRQQHCTTMTMEGIREASRECDGLLLLNAYDYYIANLEVDAPVVGMLMQDSYNGRISTVNLDPFDAARTATRYFMSRGVNHVSILSSPKPVYHYRARVFAQTWSDIGGRLDFVDSPAFNFEYRPGLGYFFSSDDWLNNASTAWADRHGERLEEKFCVLGIDGKSLLNPDYPLFPTIAVEWRRMGRIVAEELLRRLHDPAAETRNITICGRLINAPGGEGKTF